MHGQAWAGPHRHGPRRGETRGREGTPSLPGLRGDLGPPRSCFRKPSSARMAATAEATSGSSLSCALKVSIKSAKQRGTSCSARPGAAPRRPPSAPLTVRAHGRGRSPPHPAAAAATPPASPGRGAVRVTRPVWMTSRRALASSPSAGSSRHLRPAL